MRNIYDLERKLKLFWGVIVTIAFFIGLFLSIVSNHYNTLNFINYTIKKLY